LVLNGALYADPALNPQSLGVMIGAIAGMNTPLSKCLLGMLDAPNVP